MKYSISSATKNKISITWTTERKLNNGDMTILPIPIPKEFTALTTLTTTLLLIFEDSTKMAIEMGSNALEKKVKMQPRKRNVPRASRWCNLARN